MRRKNNLRTQIHVEYSSPVCKKQVIIAKKNGSMIVLR